MMGFPEPIQVSSHAGSRGEETPRTFCSSTTDRVEVVRVLERWIQEGLQRGQKEYFRVLASDGQIYILYRDRSLDLWFMEQTGSGGGQREG